MEATMANKQRGEVEIKIGGKSYKAAVTLGALAHLEDAFAITKPGELDRILSFPTYSEMAKVLHGLLNYRADGEVITLEGILSSDLHWRDAYDAIINAVGVSKPEAKEGTEGNGEAPEPPANT
jgi:hypothetical protein